MKRKILVLSALLCTTFIAGAFASQVLVSKIDPISSGRTFVPAAHLRVDGTGWFIDTSSSTVDAVFVNLTNTDTVDHTYIVNVQVSCQTEFFTGNTFLQQLGLNSIFICASGRAVMQTSTGTGFTDRIPIPAGRSVIATVILSTAVTPETTQIHDLSFIVVEDPVLSFTSG